MLAAIFTALGIWQVERREWKHALITAVEKRIHAEPAAAPAPSIWPSLTAEHDAYRRVRVSGRFTRESDTLVRAVTDLGSGYWVLTPLESKDFTVLVNRGFVSTADRDNVLLAPADLVTVTGLLRMTEPGGGFLRNNEPNADRWFSRDVAAIAKLHGIAKAAPYFIDAETSSLTVGAPIGGLTVVRFSDNHLIYALTWIVMAVLCVGAAWLFRARVQTSATG